MRRHLPAGLPAQQGQIMAFSSLLSSPGRYARG
jgi:hypothetical protein